MLTYTETPIQELKGAFLDNAGVRLLIKREDLNHPTVSGNKWWKLKYNLEEAKRKGCKTLLTFGGPYSNHIYAMAAAAELEGLDSIGIIRGEKILPLNPTLTFAQQQGMHLHFVTREAYRRKKENDFLEGLLQPFGECFVVPEGGTNEFALKGCIEFSKQIVLTQADIVCVPIGTGGTMAGLMAGMNERKIFGYAVLKGGGFLSQEVSELCIQYFDKEFTNGSIITEYHFGGYGKIQKPLIDFIAQFEMEHRIPLDPIYTGKMMFGIFDMIRKQAFVKGTTLFAIHTGGLQGNYRGLNRS